MRKNKFFVHIILVQETKKRLMINVAFKYKKVFVIYIFHFISIALTRKCFFYLDILFGELHNLHTWVVTGDTNSYSEF